MAVFEKKNKSVIKRVIERWKVGDKQKETRRWRSDERENCGKYNVNWRRERIHRPTRGK